MSMQRTMRLITRDFHHAAAEIRRIGNIRNVARELPAAISMFVDSFMFSNPTKEQRDGVRAHAIFMPGFFAHFGYYLRLSAFLHNRGIRLVIPHNMQRNTLNWHASRDILSDTIKAEEDETGMVPILIGHSKGGTDILGTLPKHPEIKLAILVSSPLRGASLRALNLYLSMASGIEERPFDRMILTDRTILEKIAVVVSDTDSIVPVHEATLNGARLTITAENLPSTDLWHCHTGLAYHARKQLHAIIENQTRIHAASNTSTESHSS